jgi:hypothetical protein
MTRPLRVLLEIGKGRKVVAAATDWPGLDRSGPTEEVAIERLLAYLPRYAGVAGRAGLGAELAEVLAGSTVEVIERTPGSSSTDFWGIAHVPSTFEREGVDAAGLERRIALLEACWATFAEADATAPAVLLAAGRTEGRPRDRFRAHIVGSELHNFARKLGIRLEPADVATDDALAAYRERFVAAIRTFATDGKPARSWPLAFLIRRTAQHPMDHAWELEDRTPPA